MTVSEILKDLETQGITLRDPTNIPYEVMAAIIIAQAIERAAKSVTTTMDFWGDEK